MKEILRVLFPSRMLEKRDMTCSAAVVSLCEQRNAARRVTPATSALLLLLLPQNRLRNKERRVTIVRGTKSLHMR